MRPKAAVFAFTSCEGCSLMLLNLEDELLDLLGQVELVNFREAIDEKRDDYDIAIIDGAITRAHEVEELREIRKNAKAVVALGACAVQGGLYFLREYHDPKEAAEYVYGAGAEVETMPVRPASHYVDVDYNVYGCPVDKGELVEVLRSILLGKRPNIPDYPICNECRTAENICVFEKGLTCFGPITRAGCGAICPSRGTGCCGCRGPVDSPPIEQHRAVMLEHGVGPEETLARFRQFNGWWDATHEKKP